MAAHQQTGLKVARWLEQHPMVTQVMHPGLESFPGHGLAASQMSGYSGVFSFRLQPKGRTAQERFVNALLPLFHLGCSWGGFESLVIPAFGLDSSAYRVSLGLEDVQDIISTLEQGLQVYASSWLPPVCQCTAPSADTGVMFNRRQSTPVPEPESRLR